jgi:cytochrome c5
MSDNAHDHHTGPIKTPVQLLWVSFFSFVLPIFIIIGLVFYVTSAPKPQAGAANSEMEIAARIQRVGSVELQSGPKKLLDGAQAYAAQCAACHTAGLVGAPKFGDVAAWSARLGTGYDALLSSALKGKGAMGAQAGGSLSDLEVARAVVHMTGSVGGKFPEPPAPN